MRTLVVEDERHLNRMISEAILDEGYSVDSCFNGLEALELCECAEYDVIVLDIMMPKMDGFELVRRLRADGCKTPVVYLTSRDSVSDKVRGLESGGDYYMVKPFDFRELIAVIHVMARKSGDNHSNIYKLADLTLDIAAKQVTRGGKVIDLTAKEYSLLEFMMRNKGMVLSREQIENNLWNYKYEGGSNVVNVYIGYLRKRSTRALIRSLYTPFGASAGCSGRTEDVGKAQADGLDRGNDADPVCHHAVFIIWVDRTGLVNDSPERLVETVNHNEEKFEAEHSDIAWDDVDFYIRGVYCAFYDETGKLLRGVTVDGLNPSDIPFDEYVVQRIPLDGDEFLYTMRSL